MNSSIIMVKGKKTNNTTILFPFIKALTTSCCFINSLVLSLYIRISITFPSPNRNTKPFNRNNITPKENSLTNRKSM